MFRSDAACAPHILPERDMWNIIQRAEYRLLIARHFRYRTTPLWNARHSCSCGHPSRRPPCRRAPQDEDLLRGHMPNPLGVYVTGFNESARKPCSAATTCAPSPIAPPTRFTEPERTSPTANTPGTDVSSGDASCPSFGLHDAPVTTKPPRSTITPQPSSQPVAGSAPTNRK